MAESLIDLDRGVQIQIHPTGMKVYMYVEEPGIYLNRFGAEVSEDIATEAGYDILRFGKQRRFRERMQAASQAISAEMGEMPDATTPQVVAEAGPFRVVDYSYGRHRIEDDEGNVLTQMPLTLEAAVAVLNKMAPSTAPKAPVPSKAPKENA